MAEGKIRVKFEAKDAPELIAAVKSLDRETEKLTGSTRSYQRAGKKAGETAKGQGRSFSALGGTLSVLRSKFLLIMFAVKQSANVLTAYIKTTSDLNAMTDAFNNLSEAAGLNADTMDRLQEATNFTVNKMDLLKQANNAMLLGIFDSTEQMAEMFDGAQRLGKALGIDTVHSIESLVTGLGRQSKLMLDNLGIVFSVADAYKKYAEELGKSVDSLDDVERKQAFVNTALGQMNKLIKDLPDEVHNWSDAMKVMSSTSFNFATDTAPKAISALLEWLRLMEDKLPSALKSGSGQMADAFKELNAIQKKQSDDEKGFAVEREQQISMLVHNIISKVKHQRDELEAEVDLSDIYFKVAKQIKLHTDIYEDDILAIVRRQLAIEDEAKSIKLMNDILASVETPSWDELFPTGLVSTVDNTTDAFQLYLGTQMDLNNANKIQEEHLQRLISEYPKLALELGFISEIPKIASSNWKEFLDTMARVPEMPELFDPDTLASAFDNINMQVGEFYANLALLGADSAEAESIRLNMQEAKMVEQLRNIDDAQMSFAEKELARKEIQDAFDEKRAENSEKRDAKKIQLQEQTQARTISGAFKGSAALLALNEKNVKEVAVLQASAALVDAYSAAQSQFAFVSKVAPPPFPQIAYAAAIAMGIAQAGQVLKAANIMEQGGIIGGRRHSQGGTMINAERGEFVMSRNAVSAIGVENLNAMNQGSSGGGGTTININGGMISPEFVENELSEAIREAVRKGSDFGIS